MESKTQMELEKAKALFYQWRLMDAYNILRRYYDRLPFKPEPEHADYIGIFTRTLLELGKDYELKFYLIELEKLYAKSKNPEVGYQLAVIYGSGPDANLKLSKDVLDELIRSPNARRIHGKAKLRLAYCYDALAMGTLDCRRILESIDAKENHSIQPLIDIWMAKVCRDEGKYEEAQMILDKVFASDAVKIDWYVHFSAQVIQAGLHVKTEQINKANSVIREIKNKFEGKNLKTIHLQIQEMEKRIRDHQTLGPISLHRGLNENRVTYENKTAGLQKQSPLEKLFLSFTRKKVLDKILIVKNLYNRQYNQEDDDKLIYYHIHSLRKFLQRIGLPGEAIVHDNGGYRLVPEVQIIEGEI